MLDSITDKLEEYRYYITDLENVLSSIPNTIKNMMGKIRK